MLLKLKTTKNILIFAPYHFLIFLDTQLHEPKISEKTISEFFGYGVSVFFRGNCRIFYVNSPPPTVEAQNLTPSPPPSRPPSSSPPPPPPPPHAEANSSLIG